MTEQQSVDLTEIFDNRQQELKVRLERVRGLTHPTAAGDEGENGWCEVLRDFLPDRYAVDRHRFVIDASGSISEQQDIVVYDSVYAPTFLVLGDTQFIPVEAVYAVFEVKTRLDKTTLEAAADKVQSVRRLKMQPAEFGVVRDEDGDLSFPPLNKHQAHSILGGILTRETTYSDPFGNTFRKALDKPST